MILSSIPAITSNKGKVYTNIPFNGALATTLEITDDLVFDNFDLSTYYTLVINLANKGKVIWHYGNAIDRDADFARLLIEVPESNGGTSIPKIKIYANNPNTLNSISTAYTPHTTLTTPDLPQDDYNVWWSASVNTTVFLGNVGIRFNQNGSPLSVRAAKSVGNNASVPDDVRSELYQLNLSGVQNFSLEFNRQTSIFGANGIARFANGSILITN